MSGHFLNQEGSVIVGMRWLLLSTSRSWALLKLLHTTLSLCATTEIGGASYWLGATNRRLHDHHPPNHPLSTRHWFHWSFPTILFESEEKAHMNRSYRSSQTSTRVRTHYSEVEEVEINQTTKFMAWSVLVNLITPAVLFSQSSCCRVDPLI